MELSEEHLIGAVAVADTVNKQEDGTQRGGGAYGGGIGVQLADPMHIRDDSLGIGPQFSQGRHMNQKTAATRLAMATSQETMVFSLFPVMPP